MIQKQKARIPLDIGLYILYPIIYIYIYRIYSLELCWILSGGKGHVILKFPMMDLILAFPFPVEVACFYPI